MRLKVSTYLTIILSVLCISTSVSAQNASAKDINSLFIQANNDYQNGRYQDAAKSYSAILQTTENGYLYFNLGNCYLKMNKVGQAILNYRRAQKFIPRFADLKMNLKYAYQETRDKIEDKSQSQLLQTIFFWYSRMSTKELLISFLALNFALFLLAGIQMYTASDIAKWLLLTVSIIYVLSAGSTTTRLYQDNFQLAGIVVAEEIEIHSGSSTENVVLFKLRAGTEVKIEESNKDWLKIVLPDGKIGWAQKDGLGII